MEWNQLENSSQIEEIKKLSSSHPVVILKHSTRCSISAAVLSRLERNWKKEEVSDSQWYFLDLIRHREISREIESQFDVIHESPHILIRLNGNAVFHASHMSISYPDIKSQLSKVSVKN